MSVAEDQDQLALQELEKFLSGLDGDGVSGGGGGTDDEKDGTSDDDDDDLEGGVERITYMMDELARYWEEAGDPGRGKSSDSELAHYADVFETFTPISSGGMYEKLGQMFLESGDAETGAQLQSRAIALKTSSLGGKIDDDLVFSMIMLGNMLTEAGQSEMAEACYMDACGLQSVKIRRDNPRALARPEAEVYVSPKKEEEIKKEPAKKDKGRSPMATAGRAETRVVRRRNSIGRSAGKLNFGEKGAARPNRRKVRRNSITHLLPEGLTAKLAASVRKFTQSQVQRASVLDGLKQYTSKFKEQKNALSMIEGNQQPEDGMVMNNIARRDIRTQADKTNVLRNINFAEKISEGQEVSARYNGSLKYHDATVEGTYGDGTFDLKYKKRKKEPEKEKPVEPVEPVKPVKLVDPPVRPVKPVELVEVKPVETKPSPTAPPPFQRPKRTVVERPKVVKVVPAAKKMAQPTSRSAVPVATPSLPVLNQNQSGAKALTPTPKPRNLPVLAKERKGNTVTASRKETSPPPAGKESKTASSETTASPVPAKTILKQPVPPKALAATQRPLKAGAAILKVPSKSPKPKRQPKQHPLYESQSRLSRQDFEARKQQLAERVRRKSMIKKIQRWFREIDSRDNRHFKGDESRRWYDHFSMDESNCDIMSLHKIAAPPNKTEKQQRSCGGTTPYVLSRPQDFGSSSGVLPTGAFTPAATVGTAATLSLARGRILNDARDSSHIGTGSPGRSLSRSNSRPSSRSGSRPSSRSNSRPSSRSNSPARARSGSGSFSPKDFGVVGSGSPKASPRSSPTASPNAVTRTLNVSAGHRPLDLNMNHGKASKMQGALDALAEFDFSDSPIRRSAPGEFAIHVAKKKAGAKRGAMFSAQSLDLDDDSFLLSWNPTPPSGNATGVSSLSPRALKGLGEAGAFAEPMTYLRQHPSQEIGDSSPGTAMTSVFIMFSTNTKLHNARAPVLLSPSSPIVTSTSTAHHCHHHYQYSLPPCRHLLYHHQKRPFVEKRRSPTSTSRRRRHWCQSTMQPREI
jgi:hypothetical protein